MAEAAALGDATVHGSVEGRASWRAAFLILGMLSISFGSPLLVYVSRWFDRRRGTAIALISSGQYIAGVVWPSVFERGIAGFGWQTVMLAWGAVVLGTRRSQLTAMTGASKAASNETGLVRSTWR